MRGAARPPGRSRLAIALLLVPAVAFLVVFYAVPLWDVILLSVTEPTVSLDNFAEIAEKGFYHSILLTTFEISLVVAGLCLLLGYPTALLIVHLPANLGRIALLFVVVPFFTSLLVRNFSWIFLLGNRGVVNSLLLYLGLIDEPLALMYNRFGVLVGMTHVLLPYAILVIVSVLRTIDPRVLLAAGSLAAPPFTAFRRAYFPLSLQGVVAAFLLVFLISIAFFVTPAMLGSPKEIMIANMISSKVGFLEWGFAAALSVVLLVTSFLLIFLIQRFFGGLGVLTAGSADGNRPRRFRRSKSHEGKLTGALDRIMNPLWPYLPPIVGVAVLAFLFLPVLIVIPISLSPQEYFVFPPSGLSLRWYEAYFDSRSWTTATVNSIQVAGMTVVMTLLLAVPVSLAIVKSGRGVAAMAYAFIISPIVMPGIIIAIAVFFFFARLGLNGTTWGLSIGHTIGALPLATVVLCAALRNFDNNLERASMSLGAGPFATTLKVTLPVIKPAIFTAAFLAFLHSFDEILIALLVSGVRARTLPKKMWESFQDVDPTIAAVSTLLILFTGALWLTSYLFRGRRPGRR